jgi:hypothetical protein
VAEYQQNATVEGNPSPSGKKRRPTMSLGKNSTLAVGFFELHAVGYTSSLDDALPIVSACDGMVVDV